MNEKARGQNGVGSNGYVFSGYVNYGEEEEMEIYGYRESRVRSALEWLGIALTLGLLRLVFHWFPYWRLLATHVPCPLQDAPKILVIDRYQGKHRTFFIKQVKTLSVKNIREQSSTGMCAGGSCIRIQLQTGDTREIAELRVVRIKKVLYVWDDDHGAFIRLAGFDRGLTKTQLHDCAGFNKEEQDLRRIVYGWNDISVEVDSILKLLILEALTPFYIFQFFTLCVWFAEQYFYYLSAVLCMSMFGISSSIIQTRRNQKSLKDKVHANEIIEVCRGSTRTYEQVQTSCLVPGDIIVLPTNGCNMQCDAVLLNGSCIVNESMLTGESVPVNKTALPKIAGVSYNPRDDINHTIFCGTRVIQAWPHGTEHVHAVVLRTGFLTAKGGLVRSILYPPPADFRFDRESYLFLGFLAIVAIAGLVYTVILKAGRQMQPEDIAVKALTLFTVVIPPALPAALTVGKQYAQNRLQSCGIQCINSQVINVAGSINCVCFDKTGTLTEDGLDMWGVVPVMGGKFQNAIRDPKEMELHHELLHAMAACHSLIFINGFLAGDPLDLKMFESTGWVLEMPEINDSNKHNVPISAVVKPSHHDQAYEIGISHQFQFSSTLQRMSSVTVTSGGPQLVIFCKGSPEMIMSLSKPSTVPNDASAILAQYTQQGYRVLALGRRELPKELQFIENIERDAVEKDLDFLGFVVLSNKLKPETTEVIRILRDAHIRVVMITGDNIQTAISVAKECNIIAPNESVAPITTPQDLNNAVLQGCSTICTNVERVPTKQKWALTGAKWEELKSNFPEFLPSIYSQGTVFARMNSDQKKQLVQDLQICGYFVAMCGDGANDCGALRAAHAGISLSEAEASVAAPFTAREPNIRCVLHIIRQCRAALSTSAGIFKFMITYSITQFLSCILLYSVDSNLTSLQFLFIDICLIINFAFFFGRTGAYQGKLVSKPPLISLLSFQPIVSLLLHLTIVTAIQVTVFFIVRVFPWYHPFEYDGTNTYASYDNFAAYGISLFQYIGSAVAFSQGKPYRQEVYTNKWLLVSLVIMTLICIYQVTYPAQWMLQVIAYVVTPGYEFRVLILSMGLINFIFVLLMEKVIVNHLIVQKIYPLCRKMVRCSKSHSEKNLIKSSSVLSADSARTEILRKDATYVHFHLEREVPSR